MTSVERILLYNRLSQEKSVTCDTASKIPSNWPTTGKIKFEKVNLCYSSETNMVLKDVSFSVEDKEKASYYLCNMPNF